MFSSIAIFGRQPAFGIAELESLFGADAVASINETSAYLNVPFSEVNFARLGGTIKLAQTLTVIDSVQWNEIEAYLTKTITEHLQYLPEGKLKMGISAYGMQVSPRTINTTGLKLKKIIKATGRSVRVVPNTTAELNSAQVLHNQLTKDLGWEFVCIRDGKQTILGLTKFIQNIEAYAARDQARPKRDARVGMLPPKLAQIIINLSNPAESCTVLDPFCGTGVVLQESLLMGYNAYGTDLEPRMIEYSFENVNQWLRSKWDVHGTVTLEPGDATHHQWTSVPFSNIACETYLGRPFGSEPSPSVLQEVMQDVDTIHRKFLQNLAKQTISGTRMCIAVPAWHTNNGFKHLKVLDSLEELGYNRVSFAHAKNQELVYYRPGQVVARELVVLQRK